MMAGLPEIQAVFWEGKNGELLTAKKEEVRSGVGRVNLGST
jgi:hypothetical protein